MNVWWTPEAEQDRASIMSYIAIHSPRAALRMDALFAAAAGRLADSPMIGPLGNIPGTRELLAHEHYRMVYQIEDNTVWILALVHTARRWPP